MKTRRFTAAALAVIITLTATGCTGTSVVSQAQSENSVADSSSDTEPKKSLYPAITLLNVERSAYDPPYTSGSIVPYSPHWSTYLSEDGTPSCVINQDLSQNIELMYTLDTSANTRFTSDDYAPEDYDVNEMLEWGKDPGLSTDILKKHGFDGTGAVIAYIDQPIAPHEQYSNDLLHYTNTTETNESMHGSSVLSLLKGKDIGTAPNAEVYFYGMAAWDCDQERHAECLYKIIEQNRLLDEDKKISMVAFSDNIDDSEKNADAFYDAVKACEDAGIIVWFCGDYSAALFLPLSDRNNPANVVAGPVYQKRPEDIFIPGGSRTCACTLCDVDYFYSAGYGLSWTMPYVFGLYATAKTINPALTKQEMYSMLKETAYYTNGINVVHPVAFIAKVLDNVGRTEEAQALLEEEESRFSYTYVVLDRMNTSAKAYNKVLDYLSRLKDSRFVIIDGPQFKDKVERDAAIAEFNIKNKIDKIDAIAEFNTDGTLASYTPTE